MQRNHHACSSSGFDLKVHHQTRQRERGETRAGLDRDEAERVVSHLNLPSFLQAWRWRAPWELATLSGSGQCPTPAHFVASFSEKKIWGKGGGLPTGNAEKGLLELFCSILQMEKKIVKDHCSSAPSLLIPSTHTRAIRWGQVLLTSYRLRGETGGRELYRAVPGATCN